MLKRGRDWCRRNEQLMDVTQLVIMELGNVRVALCPRFNAREGEVNGRGMCCAGMIESDSYILEGVDASAVDSKQDGVSKFSTPAWEATCFCTFLAAL